MRVVVTILAMLTMTATAGAASQRVTIAASPSIVDLGGVIHLRGTVDGAGETIRIEIRECGARTFHQFDGTRSGPDGSWAKDTSSATRAAAT